MGNTDTKLNFRKAIVQLTNKSQVRGGRPRNPLLFVEEWMGITINNFLFMFLRLYEVSLGF